MTSFKALVLSLLFSSVAFAGTWKPLSNVDAEAVIYAGNVLSDEGKVMYFELAYYTGMPANYVDGVLQMNAFDEGLSGPRSSFWYAEELNPTETSTNQAGEKVMVWGRPDLGDGVTVVFSKNPNTKSEIVIGYQKFTFSMTDNEAK